MNRNKRPVENPLIIKKQGREPPIRLCQRLQYQKALPSGNLEIVWMIKVADKELHQVGALDQQTLVNHGDVPEFMRDELW